MMMRIELADFYFSKVVRNWAGRGALFSGGGFSLTVLVSLMIHSVGVVASTVDLEIYPVKAISSQRIMPDTSFQGKSPLSRIRVTAARNEYEPVSFVISANRDLSDVVPVISGDLSSGDSFLSADNVDIRLVKLWYQGCMDSIHYKHCPLGKGRFLLPELLLKDDGLVKVDREKQFNWLRVDRSGEQTYVDITSSERSDHKKDDDNSLPADATFDDSEVLQPIDIDKGAHQQYWVTVYVPLDTKPGNYIGGITLKGANVGERVVPLEVEVLPFELLPSELEHGITYRGRIAEAGTKNSAVSAYLKTEEQFAIEMENLRTHGIRSTTVTQTYRIGDDLYKKNLKIQQNAGMNSNLYVLWAGSYFDRAILAKNLMRYARKFGYEDIYFFGGEELSAEEWVEKEKSWPAMRKLGGKVFVPRPDPELAKLVDLGVASFGKKTFEEALARSRFYHSVGSRIFAKGNPQGGVEDPEIYRRNYGLILAALEYDGSMSYAYQDAWGSLWNDFDGYFRDHVFAYPTTNGVIDTIQWEGYREAIDDLRYLATLNKLIEKARDKSIKVVHIENWIKSIDHRSADLDQVRHQMQEEIIGLIASLEAQR